MMASNRPHLSLVTICLVCAAPTLQAQTTATFTVSLVLNAACTISATNMDFGTQGVLATQLTATSAVTTTCTNNHAL
jgi:spore coat protein U-like protein